MAQKDYDAIGKHKELNDIRPSRLDKMVDKVQSLIDIFKNLDNGKAISAIARDEVFGVKVIYLFSQADNNIYLDRKGQFNEVSRFAQSKDGIETRTTKEIVSKYGVKLCCESLTNAAKRFRDVEMDIATYGNPATVVSGAPPLVLRSPRLLNRPHLYWSDRQFTGLSDTQPHASDRLQEVIG